MNFSKIMALVAGLFMLLIGFGVMVTGITVAPGSGGQAAINGMGEYKYLVGSVFIMYGLYIFWQLYRRM